MFSSYINLEITHTPIDQIQITTLHPCSIEYITKREAVGGEPTLLWCNGILFNAYELDVKEIHLKELQGIQHFSSVMYAELKIFQEQSKWNGYSVEVHNVTGNPVYESLTKYLGKKI